MAAGSEKAMQEKLQKELDTFKKVERELQKCVRTRQQLDAQLNESKIVSEELSHVEEGGEVMKLIGPVLVKQDLTEAKQNVSKRIEYISEELKRQDASIADLEKKQTSSRDSLGKLQEQYQEALSKAAVKV